MGCLKKMRREGLMISIIFRCSKALLITPFLAMAVLGHGSYHFPGESPCQCSATCFCKAQVTSAPMEMASLWPPTSRLKMEDTHLWPMVSDRTIPINPVPIYIYIYIYIYQCAKGIQVSPSVFGSGPNEWSSTWKAVRGGPNETE